MLVLPLAACGGSRPPNVVLIVVDSLRADALGPQGSEPSVSPRIDRLAAEGLRFERAIAPASWNLPSLSSLVTSTYPWVNGQGAPAGDGRRHDRWPRSSPGPATGPPPSPRWPGRSSSAASTSSRTPPAPTCSATRAGTARRRPSAPPSPGSAKDDPRPFFLLVHTYEVHSYFLGKPAHHAFAQRERPAYQGPFREWGIRDLAKPAGPQVIDALLGANADDLAYVRALYRGAVAEAGRGGRPLRRRPRRRPGSTGARSSS